MTEDGFAATLERLRSERERIEQELLGRLQALEDRVAAARAAAAQAETTALDRQQVERSVSEPVATGPAPATTPAGVGEPPEQAPWPAPGGLRGPLHRLLGWLLRDHLAALDLRHVALTRALLERDAALARVRSECAEALARAREGARTPQRHLAAHAAELEAIREMATRCVEAVDRVSGVVLQLRTLLNAKEAETVHVATEGARRRSQLALDELARQQEALLAELVGRRRDLEELVARLEPGSR